jgi:Zn-finger domain-containing protein
VSSIYHFPVIEDLSSSFDDLLIVDGPNFDNATRKIIFSLRANLERLRELRSGGERVKNILKKNTYLPELLL